MSAIALSTGGSIIAIAFEDGRLDVLQAAGETGVHTPVRSERRSGGIIKKLVLDRHGPDGTHRLIASTADGRLLVQDALTAETLVPADAFPASAFAPVFTTTDAGEIIAAGERLSGESWIDQYPPPTRASDDFEPAVSGVRLLDVTLDADGTPEWLDSGHDGSR
ncbi:MAG: hypothetical protein AAF074_21940, partial [Pseudomonadota bacterium]